MGEGNMTKALPGRHSMYCFVPGDEDIVITPHFKAGEFKCNSGNWPWLIAATLVEKLEDMRILIKRSLVITSGYRTPEYNASIGGAKESRHIFGLAADLD